MHLPINLKSQKEMSMAGPFMMPEPNGDGLELEKKARTGDGESRQST